MSNELIEIARIVGERLGDRKAIATIVAFKIAAQNITEENKKQFGTIFTDEIVAIVKSDSN